MTASWEDLFERASEYDVDGEDVRKTYDARTEGEE
ncbi:hypothetical protein Natoc_2162 [Natronococcus occultus SP4]|uniref:Uncharacterized protein n=1 Tax=Natronococcus occultus SP4 TaxID=694430 RepID=L0K075_9EURY|nr:hypothetical protein Natoc_2162 [Natronococcus occultus SP4]